MTNHPGRQTAVHFQKTFQSPANPLAEKQCLIL